MTGSKCHLRGSPESLLRCSTVRIQYSAICPRRRPHRLRRRRRLNIFLAHRGGLVGHGDTVTTAQGHRPGSQTPRTLGAACPTTGFHRRDQTWSDTTYERGAQQAQPATKRTPLPRVPKEDSAHPPQTRPGATPDSAAGHNASTACTVDFSSSTLAKPGPP